MYYKLVCNITVNPLKSDSSTTINFKSVNNIEIDYDLDKIGSSAKIKIPSSARLVFYDKTKMPVSTNTASQFKRGDKISISLGYNSELIEEFTGFIYRLDLGTPLVIECEGYEFQLRRACDTKTWRSTTLKDILSYLVEGTDIDLSVDIPELNISSYVIPKNINRLEALRRLKENFGLTVVFYNNILYAGLDYTSELGDVIYKIGVNTLKDNELKYQYADDVKIRLTAIEIEKNNSRIKVEIGDSDGELRTHFFYDKFHHKSDLEKIAKKLLLDYKYDGYTGKLTTFLKPFAMPGMVAIISDPDYKERAGRFEIRSVKTTFGTGGGRRSVELGKPLS